MGIVPGYFRNLKLGEVLTYFYIEAYFSFTKGSLVNQISLIQGATLK